jgi:hypothetical protein
VTAATPDHANLQATGSKNSRPTKLPVALGLLSRPFRMSRSFVRAWATVATIMALVCFAFVQPMPEHTATPRVHQQADARDTTVKLAGDHLMTSPPFVDSVLTGKTFTPYLVLTRPPILPGADRRETVPSLTLARVRSSIGEPPTRPG